MSKVFTSTKRLKGYPCTHRQWAADSHCRFVHGYEREFYFEFACNELTKEMWVVDFGGLKEVKIFLSDMFDHTFLVAEDDPYKEKFQKMHDAGIIQMRTLPNAGMEGTAQFVFEKVNEIIKKQTNNRAWLVMVEVRENEKNSAIFRPS